MKTPKVKLEQPESVADFKARLALIMRNREGNGSYSVLGAAPSDPCVVRDNTEETNHD